jgi:glycosyltransferase involved in cell wall biosynthesis
MKSMPGNTRIEGQQIWCAIPVYNNKDTVKVVARKCSAVIKNVVVVDDGSTDGDVFSLLSDMDVVVLNHETNMGKGQAILTAAGYVGKQGGEYMITIDADGQHNPEDIKKFLPIILENDSSLIIGCRDFNTDNIPKNSRFGRRFANLWLQVETGIQIDDCQSGFRAYPVKQLNQLSFRGRHYDFEAEVLAKAAWAGLELKTVPISVYYPVPTERVSHFKPFLDNLRLSLIHSMLVGRRLLPFKYKRLVSRKQVDFVNLLWHPVKFLKQLLKENATPEGLAISAAVGVFFATLPLLFVHSLVMI